MSLSPTELPACYADYTFALHNACRKMYDLVNALNPYLIRLSIEPISVPTTLMGIRDIVIDTDNKVRQLINLSTKTESQIKNYGTRPDGSLKGLGYFGEIYNPDGTFSTEISINVDDREIPALVPTLTDDEVRTLQAGGDIPQTIIDKAVDHADMREAQGKSPFAEDGEQAPRDWMITFTSSLTNLRFWLCQQYRIYSTLTCYLFVGRPIVYVDKYAAGTGDGSSWGNAYTSIQAAVNENPKTEIRIRGYGENDKYAENVTLNDCAFLQGVDDLYIDGVVTGYIDDYSIAVNTKIDSINMQSSGGISRVTYVSYCELFEASISRCTYVSDCNLSGTEGTSELYGYDTTGGSISRCNYVSDCYVEYSGDMAFAENSHNTRCHAYMCKGGVRGYGSVNTECIVEKSYYYGFMSSPTDPPGMSCYVRSGNTYITCTSKNNHSGGFIGHSDTYIDCAAENNGSCGYRQNGKWCSYPDDYSEITPNVYLNCSDSNNCLDETNDCIDGKCMEV